MPDYQFRRVTQTEPLPDGEVKVTGSFPYGVPFEIDSLTLLRKITKQLEPGKRFECLAMCFPFGKEYLDSELKTVFSLKPPYEEIPIFIVCELGPEPMKREIL